jgi:hypothetical protein
MISPRTLAITAVGLIFASTPLAAQDLSRYRNFTLGSTVAAVTKINGARPDEIKILHQRPAMIQEMRWRPRPRYTDASVQADAVREVIFSFYDDQLFRIAVDYDRQGTEGLTDTDLIESMTATYGPPALRTTNFATGTRAEATDSDAVIARWLGPESSLTLVRGTYPTNVRLVVALTRLEALAQTASAVSIQQDAQEAPQREIDRQKGIAEASRVALAKARVTNKAMFKP